MKIIEDYLDGMSLTAISKKEICTIKTVKLWVDRYRENEEINKDFDFTSKVRKRKISIPYMVQKYIIKKCSNKSMVGNDGISLNYLISKINSCYRLRKKLNFNKKISKTTLLRFIRAQFGKPYKLRKKPLINPAYSIRKRGFVQYIIDEKINGNNIFFTDEKIFLLNFIPNKQINQVRKYDEKKTKKKG